MKFNVVILVRMHKHCEYAASIGAAAGSIHKGGVRKFRRLKSSAAM